MRIGWLYAGRTLKTLIKWDEDERLDSLKNFIGSLIYASRLKASKLSS